MEYLEPDSLEAHLLNDVVYGDRTDPDEARLATSKTTSGASRWRPQPEPGEAANQSTILSDHRRVEAAKDVEQEQVPVRLARLDIGLE